jgi:hypothetical protein
MHRFTKTLDACCVQRFFVSKRARTAFGADNPRKYGASKVGVAGRSF